MRLPLLASVAAVITLAISPAAAQRREPTPEQKIDRLERQVQQMQRRVFGRQPADTAGFIGDPAATQSQVSDLAARIDAIERQMTQLISTTEENTNRVATMEAELARLRADNDSRVRALETGPATTTDEPALMVRRRHRSRRSKPPKPSPRRLRRRATPAIRRSSLPARKPMIGVTSCGGRANMSKRFRPYAPWLPLSPVIAG